MNWDLAAAWSRLPILRARLSARVFRIVRKVRKSFGLKVLGVGGWCSIRVWGFRVQGLGVGFIGSGSKVVKVVGSRILETRIMIGEYGLGLQI